MMEEGGEKDCYQYDDDGCYDVCQWGLCVCLFVDDRVGEIIGDGIVVGQGCGDIGCVQVEEFVIGDYVFVVLCGEGLFNRDIFNEIDQ